MPAAVVHKTLVKVLRILFPRDPADFKGFAIFRGETEKTRKMSNKDGIVFKGQLPSHPTPGDKFEIEGSVQKDPKRDETYVQIINAVGSNDKGHDGWIEYLVREGPHIGDQRAEELVNAFGNKVIDRMAEDFQCIMDIKTISGMTEIRARELHVWAKAEQELSGIKSWLYSQGLKPALVNKIIVRYGRATPKIVKERPFDLADEIAGVGFITADKVAHAVGVSKNNPRRIELGLLWTLKEMLDNNGSTCIYYDKLILNAQELLAVTRDELITGIHSLISSGKICTDRTDVKSISNRPDLFA